jgi:hypothetical protein
MTSLTRCSKWEQVMKKHDGKSAAGIRNDESQICLTTYAQEKTYLLIRHHHAEGIAQLRTVTGYEPDHMVLR